MSDYGVVLFHTTSAVMRAEKQLLKAGISVKLIPTPRELSSDCGIALRFDWSQCSAVKPMLETLGVEIQSIHHL